MKKIFSLLLVAVILVTAFSSVTVCAAKTPTFVVSGEKANAGDTVKITVSTKDNSGIISMKLLLKYNSKALQVVKAEEGKFKNVAFSPEKSNPFVINWIDAIKPDNKTNGVVATITFKVLDTAPQGKSEILLSYDAEDVFDDKFNNVKFEVQNGYVDITNPNAADTSSTPSQDDASSDTSSDIMIDNTNSAILEQIQQSASQQGSAAQSDTTGALSQDEQDTTQNDWIIWVVVAAIVLLGGAFAIVIIKGKKQNKE